jgi:hypothetical protein
MRLLGQRPRDQDGPPEGAGHVKWPPPGASRSADVAIPARCPEEIPAPFAPPSAAERTRPDQGNPGVELPIGAEGRGHAGSLEALRVARPEAVACASVSVQGQGGASPPQVDALRPVTDGNRVAARRGGKQPEVNGQSATKVNSIRPSRSASLQAKGEAQTGASRMPPTLRGSVSKRWEGRGGGWRRNGRTALHRTQRDLCGPDGREPAMQESEEP